MAVFVKSRCHRDTRGSRAAVSFVVSTYIHVFLTYVEIDFDPINTCIFHSVNPWSYNGHSDAVRVHRQWVYNVLMYIQRRPTDWLLFHYCLPQLACMELTTGKFTVNFHLAILWSLIDYMVT